MGRLFFHRPARTRALGPHRRWSAAHADLADIKAIMRAFGGTVKDVVLAVIDGAFRDHLAELGEDPRPHRAAHPRPRLGPLGRRRRTPQPGRSDDRRAPDRDRRSLERLASTRDQIEHLKASGQADTTQTLTTLAGLTAPSVLAQPLRAATVIGRHVPQRTVGTVPTNVRGPDHTVYAAERKMVAYQPLVPIAQGVRIGVAIRSYDGHRR